MKTPPEFLAFSAQFHQDIGLTHASIEGVIETALRALTLTERKRLKDYLSHLHSSRTSAQELYDLWEQSKSEVQFTNRPQLEPFLGLVRSALERNDL